MTIRNPDGSLACICHEHRPVCGCVSVARPRPRRHPDHDPEVSDIVADPLPGRRGWIVVAQRWTGWTYSHVAWDGKGDKAP